MRFVMKSGAARVLGGLEGWVFGVVGECVLMLWTGASSACWMWWPTGLTIILSECRSLCSVCVLPVSGLLRVIGAARERTSDAVSRRWDDASCLLSSPSKSGLFAVSELSGASGSASIALFSFRDHGSPTAVTIKRLLRSISSCINHATSTHDTLTDRSHV
jgi:hypothetical protein